MLDAQRDTDKPEGSRRRENTRQRLMDAAAQIFAEIGLDAASVEAISERAGFTRGAFYSNFESKEELLLALATRIAEDKIDRASDRIRQLASDPGSSDPFNLVREVLDITIDERTDILLGSEIRVRAMRDPELARTYIAWQGGMIQRVAAIVSDTARMHRLRMRLPADEFARVIVQVWDNAAVDAVIEGTDDETMRGIVGDRIARLAAALVQPDA